MDSSRQEFEQIKSVITQADPDRHLTAREIAELLDEHGADAGSPHQVAAILTNSQVEEEVEVIRDQPYRYLIR